MKLKHQVSRLNGYRDNMQSIGWSKLLIGLMIVMMMTSFVCFSEETAEGEQQTVEYSLDLPMEDGHYVVNTLYGCEYEITVCDMPEGTKYITVGNWMFAVEPDIVNIVKLHTENIQEDQPESVIVMAVDENGQVLYTYPEIIATASTPYGSFESEVYNVELCKSERAYILVNYSLPEEAEGQYTFVKVYSISDDKGIDYRRASGGRGEEGELKVYVKYADADGTERTDGLPDGSYELNFCVLIEGYRGTQLSVSFSIENDELVWMHDNSAEIEFAQNLKVAQAGDPSKYDDVGDAYLFGNGVEKNIEEAYRWLKLYIEQAEPSQDKYIAMYNTAWCSQDMGNMVEAVYWYLRAASEGSEYWEGAARSCNYALGQIYFFGLGGVEVDYERGLSHHKLSYEAGYYDSLYNFAIAAYFGYSMEIDYKQAAAYALEAVEHDAMTAYCADILALCYQKPEMEDQAEAAAWYLKAVEAGYSADLPTLADRYYYGNGVDKDLETASKYYLEAVEKDVEPGYCYKMLAYCCMDSDYSTYDLNKVLEYSNKAVEEGNAGGYVLLGWLYENGEEIVEVDPVKAYECYIKAYEAGDNSEYLTNAIAHSADRAAHYYQKPETEDQAEAAAWYLKAVEAGYSADLPTLADCYYYGNGEDKDLETASKYYLEAIEKDVEPGYCYKMLAYCCMDSDYSTYDLNKVLEYSNKAVEEGNTGGYVLLGWLYENGEEIVEVDPVKALEHYRMAYEEGDQSEYLVDAIARLSE